MQAESLEVLEKASVAPAQARAIVRAIEIEIAGAKDTLATKHDVLLLQQRIDALGVELRAEFRSELSVKSSELSGKLDSLAGQLRTEMAKQGGELHAEIYRAVGGSTRQMYLALLGQMAVMLGFFYFFLIQLG
jgi:hypothetical protein